MPNISASHVSNKKLLTVIPGSRYQQLCGGDEMLKWNLIFWREDGRRCRWFGMCHFRH